MNTNILPKIPSIKVFSCDHRSIDEWQFPFIRVGTGFKNNSAIKDSIEENILKRYDKLFSEGTTIWWIWKHLKDFGNPDYIGFCHYRRFFTILNPNYSIFPIFISLSKNINILKDYILTPEQQLQFINANNAVGILPIPFYDYTYFRNCKNVQSLMKAESDSKDIQLNMTEDLCFKAFEILLNNTPNNLKDKMTLTFSDLNGYHFNLLTLRRDLFEIYNNIIWKSCFEIEKYTIDKNIKNLHPRWISYLLERYTSCIMKTFILNGFKFIHFPMMMLELSEYK